MFDRTQHSTYVNISKTDPVCTVPPSAASLCFYDIIYGNGSVSAGFFSKEILTLSSSDNINGFLFGCGINQAGIFGDEAGIMDLSQEN
ncbi:hypothetical protein JRO89_XS03G0239700 [Xanthoceras sorbifolium]|uniref:Peptidase A1 domain-containing protein n=1 Tax=Xanthoceras sorbifolium TaxID=99658 RepID=A0ABQ8IBK5_9ROSI|nr:hypothetical protein JRO89_XS03G0239700 [Xanthoceras sorbifolium]